MFGALPAGGMLLIAHFSDCHLGPLPPVGLRDLVSKRVFGYLNWLRRSGQDLDPAIVTALVTDMHAAAPDHVVVTGDLVNLALEAEFTSARSWLAGLGPSDKVTVVPGNHDAYVPGGFEALCATWRDYMSGDEAAPGPATFPFLRRRGPLAIVGVSTAVATPPLMATGRIGRQQADDLTRMLAALDGEGLFRIVLIHHPPVAHTSHRHRWLLDADRFVAAIAEAGAELVLHGHDHRAERATLHGPGGPVPVIGVRATGLRPRRRRPGGGYNLYAIEREGDGFRCTMTERAVRVAGGPVETIAETRLIG